MPSTRTLHRAWAVVGIAAMLVFAGLTYAVISTAYQLRTNARLDESQAERARLWILPTAMACSCRSSAIHRAPNRAT